jgi:putative ABC transport system permease protein
VRYACQADSRLIGGARRLPFEAALVVGQIALSLVLVIAAGLLVRTFASLALRPLGFEPDDVLTVSIGTQGGRVEPSARLALYDRVRTRARDVPGVADAAVSVVGPVGGMVWGGPITVSAADQPPTGDPSSLVNFVSPGWFGTLGIRVLAGRDIAEEDRTHAPAVAVVNEAFARRFVRGGDPLRRTIAIELGPTVGRPAEIVGVVSDAVYGSIRDPLQPTVYLPFAQYDRDPNLLSAIVLSVRPHAGSPAALAPAVVAAINEVNQNVDLRVRPLGEIADTTLAQERVVATLSGFFGLLGLLLAAIGLYGVTSFTVSCRRGELATRLALGAAPRRVFELVLTRIVVLIVTGVGIGMAASVWLSQFVSPLLYGVERHDLPTLVTAAVILTVVALAAGGVPAFDAARTDPARVLRSL